MNMIRFYEALQIFDQRNVLFPLFWASKWFVSTRLYGFSIKEMYFFNFFGNFYQISFKAISEWEYFALTFFRKNTKTRIPTSTFISSNGIMRSDRVMNPSTNGCFSVLKKWKHRKRTWKQFQITFRFRFFNFFDKKRNVLEYLEQNTLLSSF